VAHGLASSSARSIAILNRTASSAEELASRLGERFEGTSMETGSFPADLDRLRDADLVVNCTPMGKEGFDADLEYDDLPLRQGQVIYDLVYAPGRTPLMERAHACGATALGGLGMLVHQGALSFEIWTGLRAPLDVMRSAAHNGLQETSCRRG
jgi:shikimate dehydrogenase